MWKCFSLVDTLENSSTLYSLILGQVKSLTLILMNKMVPSTHKINTVACDTRSNLRFVFDPFSNFKFGVGLRSGLPATYVLVPR